MFFLFLCFFNKCALHCYFFRNMFKRKRDCVTFQPAFPSSIIGSGNGSLRIYCSILFCRRCCGGLVFIRNCAAQWNHPLTLLVWSPKDRRIYVLDRTQGKTDCMVFDTGENFRIRSRVNLCKQRANMTMLILKTLASILTISSLEIIWFLHSLQDWDSACFTSLKPCAL